MARWGDKVNTGVNATIVKAPEITSNLELFLEKVCKLLVNVLHDSVGAVLLVDLITEACCTHNSQT